MEEWANQRIRSDPICTTNLSYDLYYDLYYGRNLGMDRIQSIPYILYLPQHQQQQQQQQQATISVRTLSIHHILTHTIVLININIAYMIQS